MGRLEAFLLILQGKVVNRDWEDMMVWMQAKRVIFQSNPSKISWDWKEWKISLQKLFGLQWLHPRIKILVNTNISVDILTKISMRRKLFKIHKNT